MKDKNPIFDKEVMEEVIKNPGFLIGSDGKKLNLSKLPHVVGINNCMCDKCMCDNCMCDKCMCDKCMCVGSPSVISDHTKLLIKLVDEAIGEEWKTHKIKKDSNMIAQYDCSSCAKDHEPEDCPIKKAMEPEEDINDIQE